MINITLKRGYTIEVADEKENVGSKIDIIGNYSKSNYLATAIVNTNGISPTVRENHGQVTGIKVIDRMNSLRIRKITPKEAFRLMGFDDESFFRAEKVCSNTQLYKQAGNSIVVDVLEHLFKEIMEVLDVKKVEEVKTITYECDDLIDLALLKEKEPELYEELLADYPAENATYIFKNKTA